MSIQSADMVGWQMLLLADEYANWHRLHFYINDSELNTITKSWETHMEERGDISVRYAPGSASFSGNRPVTILFEDQKEAAIFRLFFGGDTDGHF
jgi:hypothetical protein